MTRSIPARTSKKNWTRLVCSLSCFILLINTMPLSVASAAEVRAERKLVADSTLPNTKVKTGEHRLKVIDTTFSLPGDPTDLELTTARVFPEPLVPLKVAALPGENQALATALRAYKNSGELSSISDFLKSYPHSRWCASLDLNLGSAKYKKGFLSDALALWKAGWTLSKGEKSALQKSVADRALALLMTLNARLGNQDELNKFFAEIKGRPLTGTNETLVDGASVGRYELKHRPEAAFKCGPYAVRTLLNVLKKNTSSRMDVIEKAKSTSQGTNLAQVKGWADQVGLNYQMAKRSSGASLPLPAIVHWKLGHFGCITSKHGDVFVLEDPTFDIDASAALTPEALEQESDGYFLIPAGPLPEGWSSVGADEGKNVWGKGFTIGRQPNYSGCPTAPRGCFTQCCSVGMAKASFWKMNVTLNIDDIPLSYHPPIGPEMAFGLSYNHLAAGEPSTYTFTNFGHGWSSSWQSYMTVDSGTGAALIRVAGGSCEQYNLSGGVYTNDLMTQALLVKIGTNNYQRQLPDGSIQVFDQADGAGNIYMTKVIDKQNNSALIQYDANFRITTVTDAIGQVSTFTYVSNTVGNAGFYKVASIADPFGRTCSFGYDTSVTNLVSITDSIGLVSKFAYEPSSTFINLMTTPYGQTSFYQYSTYTDPTYPARGLRFNFPDGTTAVAENWIQEIKQTYYWNREAAMLYPSDPVNKDYTHCETTYWLNSQSSQLLVAVPWAIKKPLENSPTYFYHSGDINQNYVGTSNQPILTTKFLGNPAVNATVGGTVTAGDVTHIYVSSPSGTIPDQDVTYTVQAGDTLSKIAIGLANALNTNQTLRKIKFFAAANGPVVGLSSGETTAETNYGLDTRYSAFTSGGATETMALTSPIPQKEVITISGTVTPGNNIAIGFSSFTPQHTEYVYYLVQAGDTFASIAAAYASAINANTFLQGYGTTATSTGASVNISTSIPGRVIYSSNGGGTLSFAYSPALNGCFYTQQYQYNSFGHPTQSIDSIGRTFTYQYAANGIDLQQITETQGTDNFLIGGWTYNSFHRPLTQTDGSGQVTNYAYNSSNQLLTLTDANSNVTTNTYTGTSSATVSGTVTAGDVLTITVHDAGLAGGLKAVNYTVVAGNTLTNIATGLKNAVNADTSLQAIGVTASSSAAVVTLKSTSVNVTTYTQSTSGGATEVITLGANTFGYLTKIDGPMAGSQDITTMTYDAVGRVATTTDSEGYTLTFAYDNADRPTKTTYPDTTTEQITYSRLDAILQKDRIGRWSQSAYDSMDQLAFQQDPLGRKTKYAWCACGSLAALTDPMGKVTSWQHDLQGRPVTKTYQDQTTIQYSYENETSRLRSQKDALGQTKLMSYFGDNTIYQTAYQDAVNATGSVTDQYDLKFKRLTSVGKSDWGTYTYSYNPYIVPLGTPTTGGGMLSLVHNDVIPNSDISYSYDVLQRTTNRSINGATNSITWAYDAMSRITSEANALGTFGYTYVDNTVGSSKGTTRLASISYPNSQTTNFSWYGNTGDQRLQTISNLNPSNAVLSQFDYGYDSAGEITMWQQQQNGNNKFYNLSYDAAGQLTTAQVGSGSRLPPYAAEYYYGYDPSSNRSSAQVATTENIRIGGTVTTGDTLTVTVNDLALSGGQKAITYTVVGGDTLASIASGLAAAIAADTSLQTAGISAVANSSLISARSVSPNVISYTLSKSGGATETIASTIFKNGVENAVIGGTKTTGNTLTITVKDAALAGGQKSVTYTVLAADTLTTIASGLTSAINTDTSLQAIGVSASSAGTVVAISSTSTNPTTFAQSTSASATETITLSANANIPTLVSLSGSKTTGDVLTLTVFDAALSGGLRAVSYTVLAGDTLTSIASGLASAINADTSLQGIAVSATSSQTKVTVVSKSPNATSYRQSTNAGATELITIAPQPNAYVTCTVNGTKTTGNVLTLTVLDNALSGGQQAVSYTVLAADNLTSIATGLASAINTNTNLQAIGVSATSKNTVLSILSTSPNLTTYSQSVSAGATETLVLSTGVGVVQSAYNNVNELVAQSPGGDTRFQGVTNKAIKSASIASQVISITAASLPQTSYASFSSVGATETVSLGTNQNGNAAITIGGTKTTGDILTITVSNVNLSGGQTQVSYTVLAGDTLATIASAIASAISSSTSLQGIGVAATSSGTTINTTMTGTTYTTSTSGGATETLVLGPNVQGNSSVAVGGSVTTGNTLTLTVHSPTLPSGQKAITYTVLGTDTLVTIAAGLSAAINADVNLQTLGITSTNSSAATLAFSESFVGTRALPVGASTATVSAVDGANNTKTNGYAISVNSGITTNLAFDLNGNMTSDGTNTYSWDAENRMVKITYPGVNNFSTFGYDGYGRNISIVETTAGSVTSTKQFVWSGGYRAKEERDGSGALTKRFYSRGQVNSANKYFYATDHLGSVRELTDNAGTVQARYDFDPYGRVSKISEIVPSDFEYAHYYLHSRDGLNLTATRAYSSTFAIWLSRDVDEVPSYFYGLNNPITFVDPAGTDPSTLRPVNPMSPDGNIEDRNYSGKEVNTTAPKDVPAIGADAATTTGGMEGSHHFGPRKTPCLIALCLCHGGDKTSNEGSRVARETGCYVVACEGWYDGPTAVCRIQPIPGTQKLPCHLYAPTGSAVKNADGTPVSYDTPMSNADWQRAKDFAGVK